MISTIGCISNSVGNTGFNSDAVYSFVLSDLAFSAASLLSFSLLSACACFRIFSSSSIRLQFGVQPISHPPIVSYTIFSPRSTIELRFELLEMDKPGSSRRNRGTPSDWSSVFRLVLPASIFSFGKPEQRCTHHSRIFPDDIYRK
jgi:hypothetical protein